MSVGLLLVRWSKPLVAYLLCNVEATTVRGAMNNTIFVFFSYWQTLCTPNLSRKKGIHYVNDLSAAAIYRSAQH